MIIWTRWGILAGLIGFGCFLASEALCVKFFEEPQYYQNHGWPKAMAGWLAAGIVGPLGLWMNNSEVRQLIDPQTDEVVFLRKGGGHTLFFIPMKYWGIVYLVLGVVLLFV